MQTTDVVGVDPGLVHTGVVRAMFVPKKRSIYVSHEAIVGPDAKAVDHWITDIGVPVARPKIFVEGYRPRSHFNSDVKMLAAVQDMKQALDATVLLNTGVKKVVKQQLMELLGVWKFSTVTHHQDLRSAARIMLLGMLKDEQMNQLLACVVRSYLRGTPWHVHS